VFLITNQCPKSIWAKKQNIPTAIIDMAFLNSVAAHRYAFEEIYSLGKEEINLALDSLPADWAVLELLSTALAADSMSARNKSRVAGSRQADTALQARLVIIFLLLCDSCIVWDIHPSCITLAHIYHVLPKGDCHLTQHLLGS